MFLIESARRMVPSLSRDIPILYILHLQSGALYVGCTIDFEMRFREHERGAGENTAESYLWNDKLFVSRYVLQEPRSDRWFILLLRRRYQTGRRLLQLNPSQAHPKTSHASRPPTRGRPQRERQLRPILLKTGAS
jgi:hypothetical protein